MQLKKWALNLLFIGVFMIIFSDLAVLITNKFELGVILPDFSTINIIFIVISFLFFIYTLFFKKKYFILGLFLFGVSIYAYNYNLGFKVINSDAWAYLRYVKEVVKTIPPSAPLLPAGYTDAHYGPLIVFEGWTVNFFQMEPRTLFKVISIINYFLLILSMHLFVKEKYDKNVAFYCVLIAFFFWGISETGYKSYCLTGIWHFFYIDTFSLAMMFFALYFYIKKDKKYYFPISMFFGFLCFTNHLITGVILILFLSCISLEEILKDKNINSIKRFTVYSLIVFFLTYMWPYYNLFDSFSLVLELKNPSAETVFFIKNIISNLHLILKAGGAAIFGLIYLLKKKDYFISSLLIFSSLYFLSSLPYYRRFTIPFVFSLQLATALLFCKVLPNYKNKNAYKIILVIFASFFLIMKPGITGFIYSAEKIPIDIDFLDEYVIDKDSKILSDQMTEYLIRTQFEFKTLGCSRTLENSETEGFFGLHTTKEEKIKILRDNSVDYVLINKNIVENYSEIVESLNDITERVYEDKDSILLKIKLLIEAVLAEYKTQSPNQIQLRESFHYDFGKSPTKNFCANIDQDAMEELLIVGTGEDRFLTSLEKDILIKEKSFVKPIDLLLTLDINCDGLKEIIMTLGKTDADRNYVGGYGILALDTNLEEIWGFETVSNGHALTIVNNNILVGDCACYLYELNPKGDLLRQKRFSKNEWCSIDAVVTHDINGDGRDEIVFVRWFNTPKTGTVSDLVVTDMGWNILTTYEIPGIPKYIFIQDLNGNEFPEILVSRLEWSYMNEKAIVALEWNNGKLNEILSLQTQESIPKVVVYDVDKDDKDEIVYLRNNRVEYYDIVDDAVITLCDAKYFSFGDVDGDGTQELIVVYKSKLIVYDILPRNS